jgi:hypothetical protein
LVLPDENPKLRHPNEAREERREAEAAAKAQPTRFLTLPIREAIQRNAAKETSPKPADTPKPGTVVRLSQKDFDTLDKNKSSLSYIAPAKGVKKSLE